MSKHLIVQATNSYDQFSKGATAWPERTSRGGSQESLQIDIVRRTRLAVDFAWRVNRRSSRGTQIGPLGHIPNEPHRIDLDGLMVARLDIETVHSAPKRFSFSSTLL